MKPLNSLIINSINNLLALSQAKFENIVKNSVILKNLDNLIYLFICLTLVLSLFLPSESIAIFAFGAIFLTFFKLFLFKGQKFEPALCNLFLLIYLGFNIISAVASDLPLLSFYGLTKTLIYLGFYFSAIQYFKDNINKIFPIVLLIAACASFEGVLGLFQNSFGLENISTWQDTSYLNPEDVISRVYGTLLPYNPNLLGGYLIASFPCILAVSFIFLVQKQVKRSVISFILALITLLALFYTGCRGAYLAVFFMFLLVIAASWYLVFKQNDFGERIKNIWRSLLISITGLGALIIAVIPGFLNRILSIFIMRQDSSTSFRMNVYNSSIQMLQDNWFLGIGTGNKVFREIYGLYMRSGFDALSSYCIFLEIAIESGVFGLLAYLAFLYILVKESIVAFINIQDLTIKILISACVIAVLSVMVHGLVDTVYFRPQVQFVFWIITAILVVLISNKEISE